MSVLDPDDLSSITGQIKLLDVIVELFVARALSNLQLMWIPKLSKDLFNVVLVHAKSKEMGLSARLTNESAIRDVAVS